MIEHIPELVRAGIDSFKIEGRAKTAYYAAGITSAYRRAVDAYAAQPDGFVLPDEIRQEISKVSHRNYYTGFYFGERNGQFYEDSHYIRDWEVTGLMQDCTRAGDAVFTLKNRFFVGETLELIQPGEPPYRFTVDAMADDKGTAIDVAQHPEMRFHLQLPFAAKPFSILRRETLPRD